MLGGVEHWLGEVDERVRAFHFRVVLQTTDVAAAEQKLTTLVERYLHKPSRSDSDRDKLDFLLSHYLAVCAPPSFHERKLELEDVADVLEGVLGECSTILPQSLAPLEELIESAESLTSLRVFVNSRIIERGRALKVSLGDSYFASSALVALTRFNYIVRRTYRRLIDLDASAVIAGLRKLMSYGADMLDCGSAGMGVEPIGKLLKTVESWKSPRMREYGSEDPSLELMELRAIVENAVEARGAAVLESAQQRIAGLEAQVTALQSERQRLVTQVNDLNAKLRGSATVVQGANPDDTADLLEVDSILEGSSPADLAERQTKPPQDPPVTPEETAANLDSFVEQITREIARKKPKGFKAMGSISIDGHALLLNEAELAAFENPDSDQVQLRQCVAARAALIVAIERSAKTGTLPNLGAALAAAESGLARITAASSEHAELASVLSPSKTQLAAVIRHATAMARKIHG